MTWLLELYRRLSIWAKYKLFTGFVSYLFIKGAEAVERAGIIARQADVVAALTLEVLKGSSRAFDAGDYWCLRKKPWLSK